jgi:TolA-binding protein
MYKLGKVYFQKGNQAKARQWLEKVIAEHGAGPNSSAADKARQFLKANL